MEPAADSGLAVVASTMCGVYNADIARFYRELGCTRVIVPRDKMCIRDRPRFTKMPATTTTPMTVTSAFLRDQPAPSWTMDTHVSVSEMRCV